MLSLPASDAADPLQPETAATLSAVRHVRFAIHITIHSNVVNAEMHPAKFVIIRFRAVLLTVPISNGALDTRRHLYLLYIFYITYNLYILCA